MLQSDLISKYLYKKLSTSYEKKPSNLFAVNEERVYSIWTVSNYPILIESHHVSIDFYVISNPSIDNLIEIFTVEALRGCLNFKLQQAAMFTDTFQAVLSFAYEVVEVVVIKNSETDCADFIPDSNANSNEPIVL